MWIELSRAKLDFSTLVVWENIFKMMKKCKNCRKPIVSKLSNPLIWTSIDSGYVTAYVTSCSVSDLSYAEIDQILGPQCGSQTSRNMFGSWKLVKRLHLDSSYVVEKTNKKSRFFQKNWKKIRHFAKISKKFMIFHIFFSNFRGKCRKFLLD